MHKEQLTHKYLSERYITQLAKKIAVFIFCMVISTFNTRFQSMDTSISTAPLLNSNWQQIAIPVKNKTHDCTQTF